MLLALLSYTMWGFIPIYFKQLQHFTPAGILAGRIVCSVVLLLVMLPILGKLQQAHDAFRNWSVLRTLFLSATLLAVNWILFIFGVLHHEIRQCSLGYFINPLITVALGAWLFREPLRAYHRISLCLALIGILIDVAHMHRVPWIALGLATTFAGYALARRLSSVEAIALSPFATMYLLLAPVATDQLTTRDWLFMMGSGVVTTFPLICYVSAARRISFVALGFLQYLAPTLQLLVAVLLYHEPFPLDRAMAFGMIWISIGVFLLGTAWSTRNPRPTPNRALHQVEARNESEHRH